MTQNVSTHVLICDPKCAHDIMMSIGELKALFHPKNPNKHSPEQIAHIGRILKYQGARRPANISRQTNLLTVGHGRILAAEAIGWTHYPVNFQDYVDDAQEYADMVADNALQEQAELDLGAINRDVVEFGPDFEVDMLGMPNFTVEVADKLAPQCDEDEVPTHVEPRTRLGDIIQLGVHRLMCGDSTSIDAVENLMNGEKADMTFTSPPYNLGVSSKLSGNTKIAKRGNVYESYDDDQTEESWLSLISTATQLSLNHSRYSFWNIQPLAGNRTAIWKYASAFSDKYCDLIVWDKQHAPPQQAERVVNSRFELVWIWTSDDKPCRAIRISPQFRGTIDNVYVGNPQRKNESSDTHGATFPVEFPEWFISNFCPTNGSVIDLFGGSGSTLIACEKTNRRCFMMEIDPHYCDVIVARWEKYTGKKAILETLNPLNN